MRAPLRASCCHLPRDGRSGCSPSVTGVVSSVFGVGERHVRKTKFELELVLGSPETAKTVELSDDLLDALSP